MPQLPDPVATVWRDPAWADGLLRLTVVLPTCSDLRVDVPLTVDTLDALLRSIARATTGMIADRARRAAAAVDGIAA